MTAAHALLTFDLDNTLWDVESVIVRAETAMMTWLDAHHPAWQQLGHSGLYRLRAEVAGSRPDIAHDFTAMRIEMLRRALREVGLAEEATEAGAQGAFEAFYAERNRVVLYPDVLPVLTELSRRHPLYALSNGNADVGRAGLGSYFSGQLSAAGVGHAKPHPRMFERALELAGCPPGAAVHVGDHPEQDVAAAQAVGMKAVWVNYHGEEWPLTQRPDGEIRHFRDLPGVLAALI